MKLTCSACGYKTIKEEYDICPICGWEYDGVQNNDPKYTGGANTESLERHRSIVHDLLIATGKLGSKQLEGYELDQEFELK